MQEPFHPIANDYPMMGKEEFERLVAALKERGYWPQLGKIVALDGKILDGRNRWLGCRAAGIEPKSHTIEYDGDTSEEALRKFVESANDHRRHESPEARETRRKVREAERAERIERVVKRRAEGASTREIAEAEGIKQTQVMRDLNQVNTHQGVCSPETETSTVPSPNRGTVEKVKGRDGKTYSAKRVTSTPEPRQPEYDETQTHPDDEPQRESEEIAPPAPKPTPSLNGATPRDREGNPIPERLRDVFADTWLAEAIATLKGWHEGATATPIIAGIRKRFKHYPWLRLVDAVKQLEAIDRDFELALETVRMAEPYAICPTCNGDACDQCMNSGYLPQWKWEALRGEGQ